MFNRNSKFSNFKRERLMALPSSTFGYTSFPEETTSEQPIAIHTRYNRHLSDALNNQQMENRTFNINDTLTNFEELERIPEAARFERRAINSQHLKVIPILDIRSKSSVADKNQRLIHNNLKIEVLKLQNEVESLVFENCTEEEWLLCGAELWRNHEFLVKQFCALLSDLDNVDNPALSNSCFSQLNKLAAIRTQISVLFGETEPESRVLSRRRQSDIPTRNNKNASNASNGGFQRSKDFDKMLNVQSSRAGTKPAITAETADSQPQINSLLFDMINKCARSLSQHQNEIVHLRETIEKFSLNAQSTANTFDHDRLLMDGNRNSQLNISFRGPSYQNGLHAWSPTTQALNNKIAPGNRANNYLDNFKSNSRQNFFASSANTQRYSSNPIHSCERELPKTMSFSIGDFTPSQIEKREANISAIIHNRNNLKEHLNEEEHTKDEENVGNSMNTEPVANQLSCHSRLEEIDLESTLATLYNDDDDKQPEDPAPVSIDKDLIRETVGFLRTNAEQQQFLKDLLGYLRLFKTELQRETLIKSIALLLENNVTDQVQNPSEDQ